MASDSEAGIHVSTKPNFNPCAIFAHTNHSFACNNIVITANAKTRLIATLSKQIPYNRVSAKTNESVTAYNSNYNRQKAYMQKEKAEKEKKKKKISRYRML